ncbi:MAG: GDP-mannose 4,6-dehydratase [Actinomycetota bacterium]|nr:GDP-mannose 4,6-dehydratase [Actinomycetota bacterium]
MARGDEVVCIDNLSTGNISNIEPMLSSPRFEVIIADVCDGIELAGQVDAVAHLASPASPPDYHRIPLETLAVGSRGTEEALMLADRHGARFIVASTSEVYGDPKVHPQSEGYWGNVNPIGPRSVYDEAKRFAEAITTAYRRTKGTNTGIVRIFNTYGPRMRPNDGRVVSSFIVQALLGDPLTIYGDGTQTRSFCYVDDLVRGLVAMLDSDEAGPINLGNDAERTIGQLATMVLRLSRSESKIIHFPLPVDDPTRRQPDLTLARTLLNWAPTITPEDGVRRTIDCFAQQWPALKAASADLSGPQTAEHLFSAQAVSA